MSDAQPPQQTDQGVLPTSGVNATASPRRVTSGDLLGPGRELVIVHAGREYRLRLTQNGKLILTA